MAKIPKKTIENLQEFLDRGCEYAGTQETVDDLVYETLTEIGTASPYGDEVSLLMETTSSVRLENLQTCSGTRQWKKY